MAEDQNPNWHRVLAQSPEDVRAFHQMCREGRLYEVERWITEGKPFQVAPPAIPKHTRPKTALQIALETGQHSLVVLLLSKGYRVELERYSPLDLALQARRWDLFDLLIQWGGEMKSVDVYTVLNTYNAELYERFRSAGYDLTERHEMASILGHGTSNRPLLGFVKRHRTEDPKIQRELNLALGYHVREGNERGVNLCLWAGANPHSPASDAEPDVSAIDDVENTTEQDMGWSAIERAASEGHLAILKRLSPDPTHDDFDNLYRYAKDGSIITFLSTIQAPKNLSSILSFHLVWLANPLPWGSRTGTWAIEALLACKVRWEETNPDRIADIRRLLLKLTDYDLKTIVSRLRRSEVCAPETYRELIRTPTMQKRLLALGLVKKLVSEDEKRRNKLARLMSCYDRTVLYEQVWSQPVQEVAKSYGISGVRLGKVCRKLQVPAPPRGYWARVQNGYSARRPSLKKLSDRQLEPVQSSSSRGAQL
jgi:ankyrin repeat protein